MHKVFGKVLVKETGVGIPDLVVVFYDTDKPASSSPVGAVSTYAPTTGPTPAGDRLGSVLTDANGRFELGFDVKAFAAGDPEHRPDLSLLVLAPEDSRGEHAVTPLPLDQRVLLASDVSRRDAGLTEGYLLRIPRAMLEKHSIRFPGATPAQQAVAVADRVMRRRASREELRATVRERLAPQLKGRVHRRREVATAAKKLVKRLKSTPMAIREKAGTFVESPGQLKAAQLSAMKKGLTSMQHMTPGGPVIIELTEPDFVAVGMSVGELAQTVELTHEQVCQLSRRGRGGTALTRVFDLLETRKAESEAGQRLTALTNGAAAPDAAGEGEGGAAPALLPMDQVAAGVLGQIDDLTTPTAPPAASIEELAGRLMGVTLPRGPADVTSFHDFHQLQIAFEHVWTEAFDDKLSGIVQDVYKEIVALHDEFGLEVDLLTEVSEIHELEEFLGEAAERLSALDEPPDPWVQDYFPEAAERWALFSPQQQDALRLIAVSLESNEDLYELTGTMIEDPAVLRARANAIIAQPSGRAGRVTRLLDETRQRLSEPYAFHYFAPNSVNFGIVVSYRQRWEPLTYQVGNLAATIPLAPGEVRRITSKTVIKRTRAEKEVEKALSSRSGESALTQRAEAEITGKASTTTNFRHSAQGTFSVGIASLAASAEFVLNQAQESATVKKDFREAVLKAAEEYKRERTLEIETTHEATTETTTSGEISNPNNENTVTYLLYELERQYRISERIHRVTPVVLVAQDVPAPHEITEGWLLAHDWILRRVLLDDGLQPALDQLKAFAGDEVAVAIKRQNWETQKAVTEKLEATVSDLLAQRDALRLGLLSGQESRDLAKAAESAQGFLSDMVDELTTDPEELEGEQLEARVNRIRKELEFLQESLGDSQRQLATAREALDSATRAYTAALEEQMNRRVVVDQLRVHIKQNILYYMQAIWDHEPADQRFFRLYYREVELPGAETQTCLLRRATAEELARGVETIVRHGNYYVIEGCGPPQLPGKPDPKKLVEIADLDQPLGYKGNYIVFPLKACVYLTDFMMKQFVDNYFGVRDPDETANYSNEELLAYLEAIWRDPAVTLSDDERQVLLDLVYNRVREPRRESDLVVVPTGQIYMEALLGAHPLLESFKRIHRAYDVGKARAELRRAELDNLRRAARLLGDQPDLADPDVDKRVVIEGAAAGVMVDD